MEIYDYKVKDINGNEIPMSQYSGKVLLIVNTATGCGFTPQYEGLEQLYQKYRNKGFEILDFPCNQFGNQAPGSNQEIKNFCLLNYQTTFKTFAKIEVNGKNADLLFEYLKSATKGMFGKKIKWNFTKFLVDKNGKVVGRFSPITEPKSLEKRIAKLLK